MSKMPLELGKTYKILLFVLLALGLNMKQAKTQIVYTDLDPDIIIMDTIQQDDENECYLLDLNNDSFTNFDVCIKYWWAFQFPENRYVKFFIDNSLNRVAVDENDILKAKYLNLNDTINQQLVWPTISYGATICVKAFGGNYCPINEKYYGLRILQGTDTLYGWVRIHSTLEQAIIKDYAYNTTPNELILAGQTPLGTESHPLSDIISIYENNGFLTVDFSGKFDPKGHINIYNYLGALVKTERINGLNNVVSLRGLTSGIYIVHVETEDGIVNKKIYFQSN